MVLSRTTLHVALIGVTVFLGVVMRKESTATSDFRPRELSAKANAAISMYIAPARLVRNLQRKHQGRLAPLAELETVADAWIKGLRSGVLSDCASDGPGDCSSEGAKSQILSLRDYLSGSLAAHAEQLFKAGQATKGFECLHRAMEVTQAMRNSDLRSYAGTLSEMNRLFRRFGPHLNKLPDQQRLEILKFAPKSEDRVRLGRHLEQWMTIGLIEPDRDLAKLYAQLARLIKKPETTVEDIDRVMAGTKHKLYENANWLFIGKIAWTNLSEMRENTAAIRNRAFSPTPSLPYRALMSASATK